MNLNTKDTLEDLIRRYVILGKRSPKGYEVCRCTKCNDYQERGGFKFEADSVHYSCFNCSTSLGFRPEDGRAVISKKFKEVLVGFGIPESEIEGVINAYFFAQRGEVAPTSSPTEPRPKLDLPLTEVPLPKGSVKVTSGESPWCEVAVEYLKSRSIKPTDFEFYITDHGSYTGRILIPYWFRGKVVYWQGRSMDDETISPRYKNPSVEKENIFFNMDEIHRYTNEPLFVSEGPLDSISIGKNAIALAGSSLSEFRINELKKVAHRRKVIFLIDKNRNGYKLGNQVLQLGESLEWYVTTFPDNVDDANDALQKLGRLWIANHLTSTAAKGFAGKLCLELNCSKNKEN